MNIQLLDEEFSVCKVQDYSQLPRDLSFCFTGKTDEECSLVCPTADVPANTTAREDGWRGFRLEGTLDFSLIGILAGIASILADEHISIFALSTYNTDYILVKAAQLDAAIRALTRAGYGIG